MSLALLTVGACSDEEPPDPGPLVTETEAEPEPEPTETEAEPEPEPTETEAEPEPEPTETEAEPEPPEPEPQGYVPQSVVGVWCGGRNDAPGGHWTYTFAGDGQVAAQNQDRGFSGYVVTEGNIMTFHVEGGYPFQSTWSVSYEEALGFNMLYLDDFSYVPGSCDS
ncbi:hypothetical protein ABZ208_37225 [Streptomyces sp. NPDC006208]|uniref:hypothetical protein n=1 Tax=Streptomyces sp. NPDC006208 TaxID=3156734 RepID=UPI0033A7FD3D